MTEQASTKVISFLRGPATLLVALAVAVIATLGGAATGVAQTPCTDEAFRPAPQSNDVFRRYHPSGCWVETDYIDDYHVSESGTTNGSSGIWSRRRDLYCPIINDELLSLATDSRYTQVLLSAYDHLGEGSDNVLIASHCVADPFGLTTACAEQVWSGGECYGSTGDYWADPQCAIDLAWGWYILNVPVNWDSSFADSYSFIGVSLATDEDVAVSGYEVSRCSSGEGCEDWPACGLLMP
jgi:hypothetical protein